MNERFEQCLYLSGLTAQGCWDELDAYAKQGIHKFAELIVRECLAHGKLTQSQTVVNGSEEYNAGREMGIEVFMNQIKQHFEISE